MDNNFYANNFEPAKRTSGQAIASMVLGILAYPMTCAYYVPGVICAIVSIILGIVAKSKKEQIRNGGMATAGIVLSIIYFVPY